MIFRQAYLGLPHEEERSVFLEAFFSVDNHDFFVLALVVDFSYHVEEEERLAYLESEVASDRHGLETEVHGGP